MSYISAKNFLKKEFDIFRDRKEYVKLIFEYPSDSLPRTWRVEVVDQMWDGFGPHQPSQEWQNQGQVHSWERKSFQGIKRKKKTGWIGGPRGERCRNQEEGIWEEKGKCMPYLAGQSISDETGRRNRGCLSHSEGQEQFGTIPGWLRKLWFL